MTKADARTDERGCPPEVLAGISDLELVARIVVEGLVSGLHRSPFHGYSAEFSQYRHYRPGDDLKYVDWKLVARTDRVYTKQFRETTNMAAAIVIDTSASMSFPTFALRATVGNHRLSSRAKVGGSAWESNPASPRKRGATDFEDREGHRAPFTSRKIVLRIADCGLRIDCGMRTADCGLIADQSEINPQSAVRNPRCFLAFDQPDVARARALL